MNLIIESPSDDIEVPEENRCIGHLKMCSKSLVFDPKNFELPLIKIAYKNCNRIFIWPGKINGKESNVLAISCDQYTEMLAKNIVAPYTFKMESRTFLFNFHYAKVYEYLDQMRQLHRASKLHVCEQNDMVNLKHSLKNCYVNILFTQFSHFFLFRSQQLFTRDINALSSTHFGSKIFMKRFWLTTQSTRFIH